MDNLKYRIYANEDDYSELVLNNQHFAIQLGATKVQTGLSDFNYKMIFKIMDNTNNQEIVENVQLFEQFLYDLSTKINDFNNIFKIEIEFTRPDKGVSRKYIFNKGDFKDLELGYTSYIYASNALISFTINSMEQNFNSQVNVNG